MRITKQLNVGGTSNLRIRKKPSHYPEWISQNMGSIINAFSEVLASLGIITQPSATQSQQEITQAPQEVQTPISASHPVSMKSLAANVVKTYGSIGDRNLVLRSLSGNTYVELCLERMGSCKPLVTVKAKPLEVTVHEDAVKAFGENRLLNTPRGSPTPSTSVTTK